MNDRPSGSQLAVSVSTLGLLGLATAVGASPRTFVDLVVLLGVAVVLPLALPGGWRWTVAAAAALASLPLGAGVAAAALVLPWLVVASTGVLEVLRAQAPRPWCLEDAARALAAVYALVAAIAFATSRLGAGLFGVGEPIVELTAVHAIYAGCAALVLAVRVLDTAPERWRGVGRAAVVLTGVAPVVVATGFVTGTAVAQVGGAIAMALGVWATATLELRRAVAPGRSIERIGLAISGAAIWFPMVLAVAWAAGQYWDVQALSIPAMARTHGLANAIGFVLGGLVARRCARPASSAPDAIAPEHAARGVSSIPER